MSIVIIKANSKAFSFVIIIILDKVAGDPFNRTINKTKY